MVGLEDWLADSDTYLYTVKSRTASGEIEAIHNDQSEHNKKQMDLIDMYKNIYGLNPQETILEDGRKKLKLIMPNAKVLKIEKDKFIKIIGANSNPRLKKIGLEKLQFLKDRMRYLA